MLSKYKLRLFFLIVIFLLPVSNFAQIITGADRLFSESQNLITGKNIGVVCNHTALLSNGTHLVDTLINLPNVTLKAIFTPEHGFKGSAEAGELVNKKSLYKKVPVISLYGSERKPSKENLKDIDLLIFDIQDVGARFYTYISTLYNVVEAAGENNIPIIVLDRPNPIGGKYVDGPVLDENFKSFVGIAPIPITHGMTVGELATFFVGEKLINNSDKVGLNVVKCKNWHREIPNQFYSKWVSPSPNINYLETAFVYPGICLLEGTNISEGRGTQFPFLQFGAPFINSDDVISKLNLLKVEGAELQAVSFIPEDIDGMATNPKFKGQTCNGIKIKVTDPQKFESVKFGVKLLYVLNKLYGSKLNF
ncbi:MAG TPA: DUF1343 domain-containing protein, partial [Ignavibacteriaceae bacterium]|nr:DUF1343 domain-containing protein [Ignavibacteriaceae bacterium]